MSRPAAARGLSRFDLFRPREPQGDARVALTAALVLTGMGLVCVYSFGGAHVFRHAISAAVSLAVCVGVSRISADLLQRAAVPLLVGSGALLLCALLFAPSVANTKRWLLVPGIAIQFQPSELAKIAAIVFLAGALSARGAAQRGPLALGWPVGVLCALVLFAPDLGTTIFLLALAGAMMLVGGVRMGRLLACSVAGVLLLLLVASQYPYMKKRLAFFKGERNYQQQQALVAIASGGLLGNGLGAGRQKMDYLPKGHTDFVLSNIGEELGFLGVAFVGVLFGLLCIHGARVAVAASRRKDGFDFHLATGATFFIVFQAVVNIAVATAAAPTKGISLPFLSQGGSNLLASLMAVGLIVGVGRRNAGVAS